MLTGGRRVVLRRFTSTPLRRGWLLRRCSRGTTSSSPSLPFPSICTELSSYFKLGDPDEAKVAEYTAKLDGVLKVYDGILAKQKYLAGDEVTLADLFHLPYGSMVKGVGFDVVFAKYPNVDKWFSGLQERGSWKAATS